LASILLDENLGEEASSMPLMKHSITKFIHLFKKEEGGDPMVGKSAPINQEDCRVPFNLTWAIFLISVLGLFLEMLLIRWIGTEIRIFAYLQNTVLVVCFLGLGLGCFTSREPINIRSMLISLLVLVLILAIPLSRKVLGTISFMLSPMEDFIIWGKGSAANTWETVEFMALGLGLTYLLMVLILDIFLPIGRILGRLMNEHPKTIWAYSVNVGGSLVGTWLFVLLSILYLPPLAWFGLLGVLFLFFVGRRNRSWNLALLSGIIALSWVAGQEAGALKTIWSPYQKLVLGKVKKQNQRVIGSIGSYTINVNNTDYQEMIDLSEANTRSDLERYDPEMFGLSQYDIPLVLHPNPQKMLIVGAGSGNDAAAGVRHNVKEVTAVEIDPAIIDLGSRYHPEKPYTHPSVKVVNDDARSFFATCKEKYDVIAFGLLDSHTTTAMTNARLDHYVYTRESIARAKSLLAPGGVMTLNFYAAKPFIGDRMAGVLRDVFMANPISFLIPVTYYGRGGVMFIAGDLATAQAQIQKNPRLASLIEKWQKERPLTFPFTTRIASDDWPYIYLKSPSIPLLFYLLAGLMMFLLIRSRRYINLHGLVGDWGRSHWHFFFLGAAFLLLEVQNISKASVVLGNTWEVNAVIVSGVLAMILLANLVAYKFPHLPLKAVYTILISTCLALYWVDLSSFAFLPYAAKAVIVGGLTTLPMLFSGIIFIRSFAIVAEKDAALGANLIGALVGALLQSVTFVTGIKALLLLVAGLYFLSLLTRPGAFAQEQNGRQPVELTSHAPGATLTGTQR
jgi:spermidine synthase